MYLKLHIISTLLMTGAIWIIQLVHYPAFRFIDKSKFEAFENFHTKNITFFVAPVMMIELVSSFLVYQYLSAYSFFTNLLSILVLWLTTFFIFVPLHGKLNNGYQLQTINKLINLNWIRTILWSLRSSFLIYISING